MAIRKIITNPHPTLRRKARKVTKFDKGLQTLVDDMIETMREAPGSGLAAPQVDASEQVIVVEFSKEEEEDVETPTPPKLYVLVNPEITRRSEETLMGTEGCLSLPTVVGDVERALSVTVKGFTRRGQPQKIKAQGWLARIFQHEIDHLNGVLFVDKAEKVYPIPEETPEVEAVDG